jgi:hypothetical protein
MVLCGDHEAPESFEIETKIPFWGSKVVTTPRKTPDRSLMARGYVCAPGLGCRVIGGPTRVNWRLVVDVDAEGGLVGTGFWKISNW